MLVLFFNAGDNWVYKNGIIKGSILSLNLIAFSGFIKSSSLFSNIFKKEKLLLDGSNKSVTNEVRNNNLIQQLKEENKKEQTLESIVNIIESNPESIKMLKNSEIREINEYYKKKLEMIDKKIDMMKLRERVLRKKLAEGE